LDMRIKIILFTKVYNVVENVWCEIKLKKNEKSGVYWANYF